MKTYRVTFLELGLLTGTRAIAAAGLAFLLTDKLRNEHRKPVGWSLLGAGLLIYLVMLADLLLRQRSSTDREIDESSSDT